MKENRAPKKIFIPRLEGNETFVHEWSATKFRKYFSREIAENVEYVRIDAFIKKAEKYIRNVADGLDRDDDVEAFISGFRKYMKGE